MSATGSVIVMAWWPSSPRFPIGPAAWSVGACAPRLVFLPAGLGDPGQLAPVRHGPEADPAQAESLVHRARPAAPRTPRIGAHLELGLALGLGDEALLRHCSVLLEWESEPPQKRAALVIVGCGRDDGHVHAALPVHLIGVDLVEHQLLVQAEGVVAAPVELPVGQP